MFVLILFSRDLANPYSRGGNVKLRTYLISDIPKLLAKTLYLSSLSYQNSESIVIIVI